MNMSGPACLKENVGPSGFPHIAYIPKNSRTVRAETTKPVK